MTQHNSQILDLLSYLYPKGLQACDILVGSSSLCDETDLDRLLQLTQDEWVALLQESVLPLFIFVIYKVALRLNSWGPTLPIMALPPT